MEDRSNMAYFGTLSKIMRAWRYRARGIYDKWKDLYKAGPAGQYASNVPPRCISGRWGSISACEAHVLKPPWPQLVA
eukprot:213796-Pyramimonas_sp.AAC.1